MFIIPMVGLSSRFFREGYTLPKYQLPLWGATVFTHVMNSFKSYFETDDFLFLIRDDKNTISFINNEVTRLGIKNYSSILFKNDTRGQAETVYLGTKDISDDTEFYIFNIDTIRVNFKKPDLLHTCDGYLEVFHGDGDHWSFAVIDNHGNVIRTTEKNRVSELCSDGLYYFKRKSDFDKSFEQALQHGEIVKGEYFVAPLYNYLISTSKVIKYHLIPKTDVYFCGTPKEYIDLAPETLTRELANGI